MTTFPPISVAPRGNPKAADGAAVATLRDALAALPGRATVVIGEGETPLLSTPDRLDLIVKAFVPGSPA